MNGAPVRIGVIAGDGIGPELVESAVTVLAAVTDLGGPALELVDELGGAAAYQQFGEPLSPGAIERFRDDYAAVLKGPVGLPDVRRPDGTEAGLLGGVMRLGLDTFANVRPVRLLPGVQGPTRHEPGSIDYVIVRENTEGLYLSRGVGVVNERAACDQLLMTREGVERVVRFAFELAGSRSGAPADGVRRVTCVDKSNVLRSFAFFRTVFDEVAESYPDIEADYRYTDAAAHDLVVDPSRFDVIVTENFVGDLLSDLGAGTVGGLGMCPSANVGHRGAYFEPVHGSAPSLAGLDQANPTSQILSAAMLLDHLGSAASAALLRNAVEAAYADGSIALSRDGRPVHGTRAVTDAVVGHLGRGSVESQ